MARQRSPLLIHRLKECNPGCKILVVCLISLTKIVSSHTLIMFYSLMQTLNMIRLWRTLYISGALATLRTEMLNSISTRPTKKKLKQSELGSKILPPSRCFQQQRIILTTLGAGKHLEPA